MEVILKEDIRALGKAGQVVKVTDGYGRNYLLPQHKAVAVTPANLKQLEQEKGSIEVRRAKLKKEAEELAARLKETKVILDREAGEEDKLFGQVTTRQIAETLASQGTTLDHRNFHLKEPIRKIGQYVLEVHLHSEVNAELTVEIRRK